MTRTEITESYFAAEQPSECKLSIRLGMDSLAFAQVQRDGRTTTIREYRADGPLLASDLRQCIYSDRLLQQPAMSTQLSWANTEAILLPQRLAQAAHASQYLQQLLPPDHPVGEAGFDKVDQSESAVVYHQPSDLLAVIRELLPQARIRHLLSSLIAGLRGPAARHPDGVMYTFFFLGHIRLLVYVRDQLYWTNQFTYRSAEDVLYYILLGFDYCRLDPEQHPVFLAGAIQTESAIYRLLYRFLMHLQLLPDAYLSGLGPHLIEAAPHQYADVLIQAAV